MNKELKMSSNKYLEYLFERMYTETSIPLGKIIPADEQNLPVGIDPEEGKRIAKIVGLIYGGWWEGLDKWYFHEPKTKSTIVAGDIEEAREKKQKTLDAYFDKHPEAVGA